VCRQAETWHTEYGHGDTHEQTKQEQQAADLKQAVSVLP